MIKKGMVLILACMLVLGTMQISFALSALSVTANFSRETTEVTISGTASFEEGTRVHLVVLKPGFTFGGISSTADLEAALCRTDETTVGADGSFSFDVFTMTSAHNLGNCVWRVSGEGEMTEGSFYYSPLGKIIEILNTFDAKEADGIYDYIITAANKDPLQLGSEDVAFYKSLGTVEMGYVNAALAENSYSVPVSAAEEVVNNMLAQLSRDFKELTAMGLLNDAADGAEVKAAIDAYNSIYALDTTFGGIYDKLSASDKEKAVAELYKRMAEGERFEKAADIKAFTDVQSVLVALSYAEWDELEGIINDNNDVLKLDLSNFEALGTAYKKDKAMKALAENGSFFNITALADALEDAVESAGVDSSDGSGGYGGGGGGKSSSSTSGVKIDFVVAPDENAAIAQGGGIFSDIAGVSWAREAIEALYEKKIVNGKSAGRFFPNDAVTRAEFVKMLVLAVGAEEEADISFTDVEAGAWYYSFIARSAAMNMVLGYPGGTFKPNDNISRQDMATVLYRLLEAKNAGEPQGSALSFADSAEIAEYAKTAVRELSAHGVFSGDENGCFNPEKNASRAEAAKVIYSVLQLF